MSPLSVLHHLHTMKLLSWFSKLRRCASSPRKPVPAPVVSFPTSPQSSDEGPRNCVVCMTDSPADAFPPITTLCTHIAHTCSNCISKLLSYPLPRCPTCRATLQREDIERLGTAEQHPDYRPCLKCPMGQIHTAREREPTVVCHACGAKSCYQHMLNHPGSCADFEKKQKKEATASRKYVQKRCKTCPGCNFDIEKTGGCNHIRCSKCGMGWCWRCRGVGCHRH
ncbi:hypothetical protein FPQ18DRAFT_358575 [Pyronema domesticum]|nr:hypothetical protein FPQ18DRAFT_358575 [Pyronema domesticum]